MIIKILGGFDIAAAVVMLLLAINSALPSPLVYAIGIVLLLKGLVFILSFNFGSVIDIIGGGLILLSLVWAMPGWLLIIGALLVGQKGAVSFL